MEKDIPIVTLLFAIYCHFYFLIMCRLATQSDNRNVQKNYVEMRLRT